MNVRNSMKVTKQRGIAAMAIAPLVFLAACGGGGGGGSDTGTGTTGSNTHMEHRAALTSSDSSVPLAGNVVADCTDMGVGVVSSAVDAVSGIAGSSIPTSIPKLSDLVAIADLSKLPVIGGLMANSQGDLIPISVDAVTGLLPAGVAGLADSLVPGQLPVVCSSLVSSLPVGMLADPAALVGLLGVPVTALGVTPIFNSLNNPVGVLLAVGLGSAPEVLSLVPSDLTTVPVVGDVLSMITSSLLGLLNTQGILGGGLLTLLG